MAKQKHPPGEPMTLGNMRNLGLALAIGLASCTAAFADKMAFTCTGTMGPWTDAATGEGSEPWKFSLEVDTERNTLTYNGGEPLTLINPARSIVVKFYLKGLASIEFPDQAYEASFNRINGKVDLWATDLAARRRHVRASCKPPTKLF
jgi:hypothetical protein